jgi:acetyl-CoA C-acetyltransferase
MKDVYIAAAKRTPIGKFSGALADRAASDLGAEVLRALTVGIDLDPADVDEVILGQVLTGGAGQNPARQSALKGGLPTSVPATTVNMVCGAGQRSIHLAAQAIKSGDAEVVLAGGQDSMSQAPHLLYGLRNPAKMGDQTMKDSMVVDGLWDAFHDVHMGVTVESLARRYQITRDEQDEFAFASQQKAAAAQAAGRFDAEIVPVLTGGRDPTKVDRDEHPNPGASLERLASLHPAFDPEGSITAGNSSGLNDGAAGVVVGSEDGLRRCGLEPLVRIAAYASAAIEPMDMGLGPAAASRKALAKAGWSTDDLDLMEINEAFAAQAIAVNREMGWDTALINRNGGAIALGHPLAGSGCRIVVTLIHEMLRSDVRRGLASLCIGGGQGVAICLER